MNNDKEKMEKIPVVSFEDSNDNNSLATDLCSAYLTHGTEYVAVDEQYREDSQSH